LGTWCLYQLGSSGASHGKGSEAHAEKGANSKVAGIHQKGLAARYQGIRFCRQAQEGLKVVSHKPNTKLEPSFCQVNNRVSGYPTLQKLGS
jgi:hypothetical protein